MNKLRGLLKHDEGPSPEPQDSTGISRMPSRSKRASGFSGQGSHFPRRHPSMRARAPMNPRQDAGKRNGLVANGVPGPIASDRSADGVVSHGKGKTPSDDIIGTETPDQGIVARTDEPQFSIPTGSQRVPGETDGGEILPSPIPATSPKLETPKEALTTMEKPAAAEGTQKKSHGGMAATIAGGATATVAAAAAAVGVHTGLEKETEEGKAKKMEEEQEKMEEEQKRVEEEQKKAEEEQKKAAEEQKRAEEEQKKMEEEKKEEEQQKRQEEEEEQKRKEKKEKQKRRKQEQKKKKKNGIAAGGTTGGKAGEEETPEETESEPREPQPSLAGAALGPAGGGKAEGNGKGAEETTAPRKEQDKTPEAGGIPGMFPTEPEQQPVSEAAPVSKEAAGGEGAVKQADTPAATSGMPESYASIVRGGAGGQPTETAATTAGGKEGGGMGTAGTAGLAGVAGVGGGAGIAQRVGGDNTTAAEEVERQALAERQLEEQRVEEETQAHEKQLQQKKEELENQEREEKELKEKQAQTEKEIKDQKEIGKEEKGHEKAISKEEKRKEKEAKEAKKAEEKARKKEAKQAKRQSTSEGSGGKKGGIGGGLFSFFGRRMSSKGGGSGEAAKATSNGSKATGKQPMKPEAETGAGAETQGKGAETSAPDSKTNGTGPNGSKSRMQPLVGAGETSSTGGQKSTQDGIPKLEAFPAARGGGTVSPLKTRTHSGPQFQANIPSLVTP